MIRPFDIRDVSLVQRLSTQARALAQEFVATEGVSPLREAMRAYVSGGRDSAVVLVERSPEHNIEAFGLMHLLPTTNNHADGEPHVHPRGAALILMSPRPTTPALVEAWTYLAHEFASEAAQRGAHHLVAEVPEGGQEWEALHSASFVPLIQQDLFKLTRPPAQDELETVHGLREQHKEDEPQVRALHLRAAPKMSYPAEFSFDALHAAHRPEHSFVLVRANEVLAHLAVRQGKRAYGLRVHFRPEVEDEALAALRYVLARTLSKTNLPLYVTIRQYQSWMLPALDALGFTHVASNVLMVRHTAKRLQHLVWSHAVESVAVRQTHSASLESFPVMSPNNFRSHDQ